MRITVFALLLLLFPLTKTDAQAGNPAQASDSTSLNVQFEDMLQASNKYLQFKVVRQDFLRSFMANVSDSIQVYTKEITDLNGTISTQSDKISSLSQEVKERDERLVALGQEKDSMNLLGTSMGKGTYTVIVWGLILGLLALLAFAFVRMRLAVATAAEARDSGNKLAEELEKAKKRRLEVEQSLRRQLQDEINKRNG